MVRRRDDGPAALVEDKGKRYALLEIEKSEKRQIVYYDITAYFEEL